MISIKFVRTTALAVLACILPFGLCAAAEQKGAVSIDEALRARYVEIKLIVKNGELKINLKRERLPENETLKIRIPSGVTKIGFIDDDTRTYGYYTVKHSTGQGSEEIKFMKAVITKDLNGKGLELNLAKETILTLSKNLEDSEGNITTKIDGKLLFDVPHVDKFELSGMSGTMSEGEVGIVYRTVAWDDLGKKKYGDYFIIMYTNMRLNKVETQNKP